MREYHTYLELKREAMANWTYKQVKNYNGVCLHELISTEYDYSDYHSLFDRSYDDTNLDWAWSCRLKDKFKSYKGWTRLRKRAKQRRNEAKERRRIFVELPFRKQINP